MTSLLNSNFPVFSKSLKAIGHTDLIKPELKFTSSYPIRTLPFPIPQALEEEAKRQIHELIDAGIIEKHMSNWACPMLLVKKKSTNPAKQAFRLALDLRLLNSIIQSATYPLPKISNLIAQLSHYKYFTTLDMPAAYHQLDMPKEYQDQLSFVTPWSSYKYTRLVFGLKTAASSFQALMDSIIEKCNTDGIFAYQDDLIVASNSFEETLHKLQTLFNVMKTHNLTLFAAKCNFHQTTIKYLGFEISQNKIFPIDANITKITSFPKPTNKKQLKRFLGTTGYYRHLVPAYAEITSPLVALTSPKVKFIWSSDQDQAFTKLQQIFFSKPFIQQPQFDKEFFLNTDASKTAISAILMQEHNGTLLPVSYFSRSLKNAETRYEPIKLELMAIVHGVQAFHYYLYGRKFTILSDSKPLKFFAKSASPTDLVTRWLIKLSEYSYTFQYLPGKENLLADLFSRTQFQPENILDLNNDPNLIHSQEVLPISIPHDGNNQINVIQNSNINEQNKNVNNSTIDINQTIPKNLIQQDSPTSSFSSQKQDPLLEISCETILKEQLKDKKLSKIYNEVVDNVKNSRTRGYVIDKNSMLLMFSKDRQNNKHSPRLRIVLPPSLRTKALKIAHLGHPGVKKTFQNLQLKYHWLGAYADTHNYVTSCEFCLKYKHHNIPQAPFQNNPIPNHPGDFISMDIVGPFQNGQHILTIIDHFSRHLSLYTLSTISAENVIKALFEYITVHGRPSLILSDLGSQFTSHIFKAFTAKFGIKLIFTSISHPQTNALSERVNNSIKTTISTLQAEGYNFHNAVRLHQMLYNSSIHSTTNTSPNFVHFGRHLSTLYDTFVVTDEQVLLNSNRIYFQLSKDLHDLYQKIYNNLLYAQKLQNANQQKHKLRKINLNDIVYLKNFNFKKNSYGGPFKVVKIISPTTVKIQRPDEPSSPPMTIHLNRLWIAPPRRKYLQDLQPNSPDQSQCDMTSPDVTSSNQQHDMPSDNQVSHDSIDLASNESFSQDQIQSNHTITPPDAISNQKDYSNMSDISSLDISSSPGPPLLTPHNGSSQDFYNIYQSQTTDNIPPHLFGPFALAKKN